MFLHFLTFLCLAVALKSSELNLQDLKWKNRILTIESSDSVKIEDQLEKFSKVNNELTIRKLRIFVKENNAFYEWPGETSYTNIKNFPKSQKGSFQITLIGLDGGQKWHSNSLTSAETIFDLIDAMPMRISEIKS